MLCIMMVINHIMGLGGFVGHGSVGGTKWKGRLTELVRPKITVSGIFTLFLKEIPLEPHSFFVGILILSSIQQTTRQLSHHNTLITPLSSIALLQHHRPITPPSNHLTVNALESRVFDQLP